LELCRERAPLLLSSSEEILKTYEKDLTLKDLQESIRKGWQGVLQLVLAQVFRKVVQQIKGLPSIYALLFTGAVAPGEEFRAAFSAARQVGCTVVLGDRPISITLSRTWGSLGLW
jgi:pheromone shutdown protein TraB